MPTQVIDFSKAEPPQEEGRLRRSRMPDIPLASESRGIVQQMLPTPKDLGWDKGELQIPPDLLEAAKATFTATGGNISKVAAEHDLAPKMVSRLAARYDWPVYGEGYTPQEKSRKTRLERLASTIEGQLQDMAEAMGVETKDLGAITQHGMESKYVAPLSQRSTAFSALFDRYMRIMTLLEPELFGADDDPSNPVAAKLRQKANQDALGGVEGINRQMADFAARVATGVMDHMASRSAGEIIDVAENE